MTVNKHENLLDYLVANKCNDLISNGKIGIEKESLRVRQGQLLNSSHPKELGSALCNKYITTDFSESLLEFVTEPYSDKDKLRLLLDDIHHFVSLNIGDEKLWPLSYPPHIDNLDEILIAEYGSSNLAKLKRGYRAGLANRYGKQMQIIAGIHYNYSFPDVFWEGINFDQSKEQLSTKNEIYFRGLRNIQRLNWLILYFLGASPIIPKSFYEECPPELSERNDYYFSQYATSLRMSKYGYQNINQTKLNVSFDSLEKYSKDLKFLTKTSNKEFEKIGNYNSKEIQQLNTNYLQTEDEYYSIARPKNSEQSDRRTIKKLNDHGIDYIEYRAIDLNPFSRIGIKNEDILFLEIFLVYCSLKESPLLDKDELSENYNNSLLVSLSGRDLKLSLSRKGQSIFMKDWAEKTLDEMRPIADLLGINKELLDKKSEEITSPEKTISGRMLERFSQENISYQELGTSLSEKYSEEYMSKDKEDNVHYGLLKSSAEKSLFSQLQIEQSDKGTFKEYLEEYFLD